LVLRWGSASLCLAVVLAMGAGTARAERITTREALDRLEEVLTLAVEDGSLDVKAVVPALVVSAEARYEASVGGYNPAALSTLTRVLPPSGLRVCEACTAPRTHVEPGRMEMASGPLSLDELVNLDARTRGTAPPAKSAIWLDEHGGGVAIKIVELNRGRILFARNIDPQLVEQTESKKNYRMAAELDRRARGDSITQAFFDAVLFPGQHISLDWTEQWGATNNNLSGVSISLLDPVVGLGVVHYRAVDFMNMLFGIKAVVSVPTALAHSISGEDTDIVDPLLTAVFLAKVPFGRSNYGAVLGVSTNGVVGVGISLMNVSVLPVLP